MAIQKDGYQTTVAFSAGSSGVVLTTLIKERTVKPPGIDGGGPILTTTMRNANWRTAQPKSLKTLTPSSITVTYDPSVFDELVAMTNINQSIVITFPDATTLTFWGWINTAEPSNNEEGEEPTMEIGLEISNANAAGTETAPVFA